MVSLTGLISAQNDAWNGIVYHNTSSPQCQFKQASAQDFVFSGESFNYVTSFSCLHWVKDLKQVLKKIKRVLKPQGKFIGNMAHTGHFFYKPVMKTIGSAKWSA